MNLEDLYQEIILDHFKHPRNAEPLNEDLPFAEGENPNCGDLVRVTADLEDEIIRTIQCDARGCAISIASASIMSEHLLNIGAEDARGRIDDFETRITGKSVDSYAQEDPMSALLTIRRFPMRLKCAILPWAAIREFLMR